jgi:hypothetical protein
MQKAIEGSDQSRMGSAERDQIGVGGGAYGDGNRAGGHCSAVPAKAVAPVRKKRREGVRGWSLPSVAVVWVTIAMLRAPKARVVVSPGVGLQLPTLGLLSFRDKVHTACHTSCRSQ